MTPDEVLEALKAIILQRLGLLTRQEQLTVVLELCPWVIGIEQRLLAGIPIDSKPAGTEPSA